VARDGPIPVVTAWSLCFYSTGTVHTIAVSPLYCLLALESLLQSLLGSLLWSLLESLLQRAGRESHA
jgi:hypothetical protein